MEISLAPEILGHIGNFPITNTLWVAFATSSLLIIVSLFATRRLQQVPKGLQFWGETVVEGIYGIVQTITNNEKLTKKFFPFAATLLLFFLVGNMFTFLPGVDAITFHHHHLYRTITTDYNVIFAITFLSFLFIQISGISGVGIWHYIKKFINFSSPINFFVGILELIGEFARILSLSFRLFGNMFAKKVLALVILMLVPFFVPVAFNMLGLIVAVIQPIVFLFIVMISSTISASHHEE
ncbi:MAG TPA: FoF1 ATP synthase subunit a [Patescibacteria group bacterium]|nr:FoF1 ATP synthase subunit a [Patescibacteria group bacterium]